MIARGREEMEAMAERIETRDGGQVLLGIVDLIEQGESVIAGQGQAVAFIDAAYMTGAEVRIGNRKFNIQVSEVK